MKKPITKYIIWSIITLICHTSLYSQLNTENMDNIISGLERLNDTPASIIFHNTLTVNNKGGHLQGIQYFKKKKENYYYLTGSSEDHSYYAIVKTGKENKVISINKMLVKPFKHAGGFQIYKNLMAIGVEDNTAKDKSQVLIYRINNPENDENKPFAIINREGEIKRATAGAVGITKFRGRIIVVVGDWDAKHLDFYIKKCKIFPFWKEIFELVYTLDTKSIDKSGWIDDTWLSYQNINFIQDENNQLYLAGMAVNNEGQNVIDVYKIEAGDLSSFHPIKIYTRKFEKNKHTSFRYGAGIYITKDKQLKLLSCGENITESSLIHIYK